MKDGGRVGEEEEEEEAEREKGTGRGEIHKSDPVRESFIRKKAADLWSRNLSHQNGTATHQPTNPTPGVDKDARRWCRRDDDESRKLVPSDGI